MQPEPKQFHTSMISLSCFRKYYGSPENSVLKRRAGDFRKKLV